MTRYPTPLEQQYGADLADALRRLATLERQMAQAQSTLQTAANPPMFRMYQTIAQPITTGVDAQVLCDTSHYDTAAGRAGSSPWNYVIPTGYDGKWQFTYMVPFVSNTSGSRAQYLKVNGARLTAGPETEDVAANNDTTSSVGVLTVPVNAGDSVALWAWQNSGVTLNTAVVSGIAEAFFEGRLVSRGNP